ncbi:MAG TPA: GNAT family N-acetyltransferase [Tepidisphaeraceae bacterium]|nr:GNAT family N-acetyltransferase [Tepidisphaeraceae bacterium]
MRFDIVSAQEHRPDYYADVLAGHRAVRLVDDSGRTRGELVWRLASGQSVEITEFGIYDEADRRRGWGSRLLEAGIASMREFFADKPYRLRRVYLFCDAINEPGRRFYEARGFELVTIVPEFYHYCDAAMYVRRMDSEGVA